MLYFIGATPYKLVKTASGFVLRKAEQMSLFGGTETVPLTRKAQKREKVKPAEQLSLLDEPPKSTAKAKKDEPKKPERAKAKTRAKSTVKRVSKDEGKRKTKNGVTYELRGGYWYKVDEAPPVETVGGLGVIQDDEPTPQVAINANDETPVEESAIAPPSDPEPAISGNSRNDEIVETPNAIAPTAISEVILSTPVEIPAPIGEPSLGAEAIAVDYNTVNGQRKRQSINKQVRSLLAEKSEDFTTEELTTLAQYSGKGGIKNDETSLNEYYTRPDVAKFAVDLLERHGFKGGSVLEPSCGHGVFLGELKERGDVLPVGVEIDETSSACATALNPHADVQNVRFERFLLDNPGFMADAIAGNIPFGTRMVNDDIEASKYKLSEHRTNEGLFMAECMDRLKPGGVMSMVVPHGVVSGAQHQSLRAELMKQGRVIGAYRLPDDAFKHSGTSVVTDILVMQKHPDEVINAIARGDQVAINATADHNFAGGGYFDANPQNILGEVSTYMRGDREAFTIKGNTTEALKTAPELVPTVDYAGIEIAPTDNAPREGDTQTINGRQYRLEGNPLRWHLIKEQVEEAIAVDPSVYGVDSIEVAYENLNDIGKRILIHPDNLEAYTRLAAGNLHGADVQGLRDAVTISKQSTHSSEREKLTHAMLLAGHLKLVQSGDADTAELELSLGLLQSYREKYGDPASDRKLSGLALQFPALLTLQGAFDGKGKISDYFANPGSVVVGDRAFDTAGEAVGEAYRASSATPVSLDGMREYLNSDLQDDDLRAHVLADPTVGFFKDQFMPMDRLIRGNGFELIEQFKAEAANHPDGSPERRKLEAQIAETRSRMQTRSLEDMNIHLWAVGSWIPDAALNEYLRDRSMRLQVTRDEDGKMVSDGQDGGAKINSGILRSINGEKIRGNEVASYNYPMKNAIKDLEVDFKEWLGNSDYRFEVEDSFNQAFNGRLPETHSGEPIAIAKFDQNDGDPENGVRAKKLHDYQNSTIRQMAESGTGIMALGVGLGKTATSIGLAMHLKETGRANKPSFVVPKSVLANWVKEFKFWAPDANVMILGMSQNHWADGSEAYEVPGLQIAMQGEKQQFLADGTPMLKLPGFVIEMSGSGRKAQYKKDKDGNYLVYSEDETELPAKERSLVPLTEAQMNERALFQFAGGAGNPQRDEQGNYIAFADDDHNRQNPILLSEGDLKKRGVLSMKTDDAATKERKMQQVAQNNYDAVLMSEPVFQKIGMSPEKHLEYLEAIVGKHLNPDTKDTDTALEKLRSQLDDQMASREGERQIIDGVEYELRSGHWNRVDKDGSYKELAREEAMKAGLLARDFNNRTGNIYWEDLGIDCVLHDEAHHVKNLFAPFRSGSDVAFLSTATSKRSLDFYMKAQYTRETNNNQNVYLLTATPTTNNPLEAYNMLSHVCPHELEARGIFNIDHFLEHFGKVEEVQTIGVDLNPTVKNGLVGFQQLNDLRSLFNQYCRMQSAADVGLSIPAELSQDVMVDMSPAQKKVYDALRVRAQELIEQMKDPGHKHEEGDDHIFSIISDMDKAAIDLNYYNEARSPYGVDPEFETEADSLSPKIQACAQRVMASKTANGGKQLIFCDAVQLHEDLKRQLVVNGYPEDQIMIVNAKTAKSPSDRQKISQAYNAGKITMVIGNTATMGEGMNFQIGTTDIHHLTTPWTPAAIEQRNGRGVRQGNELDGVGIHYYQAKSSFDAYRKNVNDRKRGWIDDLWKGDADEAVNQNVGLGGEDLMFLFSDDPDKARVELENNKEAQLQKFKAAATSKAMNQFKQLQGKKSLYGKMSDLDKKSDKGRKLADEIAQSVRSLSNNEHFDYKALLDNEHPVYVHGDGTVLAPGGHIKEDEKGRVFRISAVDLKNKKLALVQVSGSNYYPNDFEPGKIAEVPLKSLNAERGNGFKAAEYNDQIHQDRLFEKVRGYEQLRSLSPEYLDSRRAELIEKIRSSYDSYAYETADGTVKTGYGNDIPADAKILMPQDGNAADKIVKAIAQGRETGEQTWRIESVLREMTGKDARDFEPAIAQHRTELRANSPKEGDTRTNAAGNPEVYKNSRWHSAVQPEMSAPTATGATVPKFENYEDAWDHVKDAISTFNLSRPVEREVTKVIARSLSNPSKTPTQESLQTLISKAFAMVEVDEEAGEVDRIVQAIAPSVQTAPTSDRAPTSDQLAAQEALQSIWEKGDQKPIQAAPTSYSQENQRAELKQTRHAKKGIDLHVVALKDRIAYDEYKALERKAKELGGYYSRYDKQGAIPGFQFEDRAKAEQFMDHVHMDHVHGQDMGKSANLPVWTIAEIPYIAQAANNTIHFVRVV